LEIRLLQFRMKPGKMT